MLVCVAIVSSVGIFLFKEDLFYVSPEGSRERRIGEIREWRESAEYRMMVNFIDHIANESDLTEESFGCVLRSFFMGQIQLHDFRFVRENYILLDWGKRKMGEDEDWYMLIPSGSTSGNWPAIRRSLRFERSAGINIKGFPMVICVKPLESEACNEENSSG